MKKMFKKLATCALATLVGVTSLAGCINVGPQGEQADRGKTQLYVSHYLGGVGNAWLTKIKTEFESLYEDYKGENGKVGVQVMINDHKQDGESLAEDIKGSEDEVYFTDKSRYYDTISTGSLLDISSIVTKKVDGVSLEDRMTEQQKGYYKYNDKYYALPHYESFGGLTYNKNLWNTKSLYFAKGKVPSEFSTYTQANNDNPATGTVLEDYGYLPTTYTNAAGEKSAGPDGKYGTFDDGMPATYEEFFVLCDYMVTKQVTPFTWTGRFGKAYMHYLFNSLWADVDGAQSVSTCYGLSSNSFKVVTNAEVKSDSNGFVKDELSFENVTINDLTGYKTYQTEGMYRAYEFVCKMVSDSSYYSTKLTAGQSHYHTDAQREYVLSEFEPEKWNGGKAIAMLVEGNYWENETRDATIFNELPGGRTAEDVSYAHMPIPKVDESRIGTKNVIVEAQQNISFIKGNIADNKKQLALDFLEYCYSEAKLKEFTEITGVTRGLNYDLDSLSGVGMTDYAKSLIEYKKNADVVYLVSGNPVYTNNQSYFTYRFSLKGYDYAFDYIYDEKPTALQVFNKLKEKRNESTWKSTLGLNG